MNGLATIAAADTRWHPIATIPDERLDGGKVLLWADGPVIGRWFCGDWLAGHWSGGRWVGWDCRTISNVSLWREGIPATMLQMEAAQSDEAAQARRPIPLRRHRSPFLDEVEEWLARTGIKASELGRRASSDPNFVAALRSGRDPGSKVILRVRTTMSILEALHP